MNDVTTVPKLVLRREIAASAEDLFDAWLDPASLAVWMRPGSTRHVNVKVDPRVGGAFEIIMHTDTGPVPHTGIYRAIERPRKLVFTWNSPYAQHIDSVVTVEFLAARGATEIVLTHEGLPSVEMVAAHNSGWSDILGLISRNGHALRPTG